MGKGGCGIFAYVNHGVSRSQRFVVDALVTGLRRLEYRGYDSAGLSVDAAPSAKAQSTGSNGAAGGDGGDAPGPLVFRATGKVDALVACVESTGLGAGLAWDVEVDFHAGIAHTRWATHGAPLPRNAHPHVSDPGHAFVVVHNGIITNHAPLRETLQRHGFVFESDTDTEVIPKLAKYLYDSFPETAAGTPRLSFLQLVQLVVRELDGAYALIFKSSHYPGELVAAKRGSPLLLAIRDPAQADAATAAGAAAAAAAGQQQRSNSNSGSGGDGGVLATADSHDRPAMTQRPRPGKRRRAEQIEFFLASDASAVIEHTKKVVVLEDDDCVHLAGGSYAVYRLQRSDAVGAGLADGDSDAAGGVLLNPPAAVHRVIQTLELEVEQIMRGKWDHFMAKEIHEQPDSLRQTMRGRVIPAGLECPGGRIQLGGISAFAGAIRRSRRLMFIACGSSFHGCLAVRPLVEELTELPVQLELASDFLDRRCPVFRGDTCVFVSQSGETADTLRALEYAKGAGALCVGVVNAVGSAIARATDCGIHINAGAEIGVASTKAYTSQIVCLVMMAILLSEDFSSKAARRAEIIAALQALPDAVADALRLDSQIQALAKSLVKEQSMLVFGRGWNYATALEAALKVKEVALMHSEGILAGEMKHGPLALVDASLPLLCVATSDNHLGKMESVCEQLRARGGRLILLVDDARGRLAQAAGSTPDGASRVLVVPRTVDCLQSVVNAVPLQLLAYHLTVLRGHNVDRAFPPIPSFARMSESPLCAPCRAAQPGQVGDGGVMGVGGRGWGDRGDGIDGPRAWQWGRSHVLRRRQLSMEAGVSSVGGREPGPVTMAQLCTAPANIECNRAAIGYSSRGVP